MIPANKIYDILVKVCGASENMRDNFIYHTQQEGTWGSSEYRFQGKLGFGGKFWIRREGWDVNCYSEDETPERLAIIKSANEKLRLLRDAA